MIGWNRVISFVLVLLLLFILQSPLDLARANTALPVDAVSDARSHESVLMQYIAGGHVRGFSQDGVTVTAANHKVKVEFLNARAVASEADGSVKEGDQIAPPLSRVTYHNIWDGVTVIYEASQGLVVKSTYYISATEKGVTVGNIRLLYNRPVRLDEQGNLVITYDTGTMVESTPIAWQAAEGQRKPVIASQALFDLIV